MTENENGREKLPAASMKHCPRCNEDKPASAFYRNRTIPGGLAGYCKVCEAEYKSTNERKAKIKQYCQRYAATEKGKASARKKTRKYLNTDKGRRYNAKHARMYRSKESGKRSINSASRKRYADTKENNPNKHRAVWAVKEAVKRGEIPPISTQQCAMCNRQAAHYHHWSYEPENWLDVEPLCRPCHRIKHLTTS